MESKSSAGTKLQTTYRVLADKRRLEVLSRFEGTRGSVTVRRVYDGAKEG